MKMSRKAPIVICVLLVIGLGVVAASTFYGETSGTSTWEATNGPNVTIDDTEVHESVPLREGVVDLGHARFESDGNTDLHVDSISGEWISVSQVQTSNIPLRLNVNGKNAITVDSGFTISEITWRDIDTASNDVDLSYSFSSSFFTPDFDVHGLEPNTPVRAYYIDSEGEQTMKSTTTDGDGTGTFEMMSGTYDVIFKTNTGGPWFDNASASPSDGEGVGEDMELSIDVYDPDFPYEEVEVTFYLDGSVVDSVTMESNGTATADATVATGGDNEWYAVAEDLSGATATSDTFTFETPDELEVREETGDNELLDNVTVEIEFYFDRDGDADLIVERVADNGTVDMAGLPIDESFIAVASAEGYFNRRIYVPSLFETQVIYMLNDTDGSAVQPAFKLTDFTGYYPVETTVLEIRRAINGTWQTVEGDYFGGPNEVSAQLEFNVQHRLRIVNAATGRSRNLGPYTPTESTIIDLEVHHDDTVVSQILMPHVLFSPDLSRLYSNEDASVTVDVNDRGSELDSYTVKVMLDDGAVTHEQTYDEADTIELQLDLTDLEGRQLIVWANWTTADGTSMEVSETYDIVEYDPNQFSLLSVLLSMDNGGPNTFTVLLVIVSALLVTGYAATTMGSGGAGLAGLGIVALGAAIGFVPWNWFIAGMIAWLVLAGVRNRL